MHITFIYIHNIYIYTYIYYGIYYNTYFDITIYVMFIIWNYKNLTHMCKQKG